MALVVEDGTGRSDAEAYVSVADADAYFAARSTPSAWSSSTNDQKEAALRMAAEFLDMTYGLRWKGKRVSTTQALDWPRSGVEGKDGLLLSSSSLPEALVRANAELAARQRSAELVPDESAGTTDISKESVQVGPIRKSVEYAGLKSTAAAFPKVTRLLAPLLEPADEVERA